MVPFGLVPPAACRWRFPPAWLLHHPALTSTLPADLHGRRRRGGGGFEVRLAVAMVTRCARIATLAPLNDGRCRLGWNGPLAPT